MLEDCADLRVRLLRLAARPTERWPTRVQPATACALGLGEAEWPCHSRGTQPLPVLTVRRCVSVVPGLSLQLYYPIFRSSVGLLAEKKQGKEKGQ